MVRNHRWGRPGTMAATRQPQRAVPAAMLLALLAVLGASLLLTGCFERHEPGNPFIGPNGGSDQPFGKHAVPASDPAQPGHGTATAETHGDVLALNGH